jgi:hypothetical protein
LTGEAVLDVYSQLAAVDTTVLGAAVVVLPG